MSKYDHWLQNDPKELSSAEVKKADTIDELIKLIERAIDEVHEVADKVLANYPCEVSDFIIDKLFEVTLTDIDKENLYER